MRKFKEGQIVRVVDIEDSSRIRYKQALIAYVELDSYSGTMPYRIETVDGDEWCSEKELKEISSIKEDLKEIQRYDVSVGSKYIGPDGLFDSDDHIELENQLLETESDSGEWVKWLDVEKLLNK